MEAVSVLLSLELALRLIELVSQEFIFCFEVFLLSLRFFFLVVSLLFGGFTALNFIYVIRQSLLGRQLLLLDLNLGLLNNVSLFLKLCVFFIELSVGVLFSFEIILCELQLFFQVFLIFTVLVLQCFDVFLLLLEISFVLGYQRFLIRLKIFSLL